MHNLRLFESNSNFAWVLLGFCFTTLSDWLKKLALPTQPISCKITKTNRDLVTRLLGASYVYLIRVLIGSLCCLRLLRLAIALDENRSFDEL